jgi:hypothetical protein
MERTPLNEIPESGTPELLYQIEVLARTFAMLGAASLYAVALWGLTNYLRLTKCFPWSDRPLSNWMIWLALAVMWNLVAVNIYRIRILAERQRVLLTRFKSIRIVTRQEQEQIAGQLALEGK